MFSDLIYDEQMHLAERELSSFIRAVTELYGPEQARLSAEDWLDESDSMDTLPFSTERNWRAVTIAASARLANRLPMTSNHPNLQRRDDTKVSPGTNPPIGPIRHSCCDGFMLREGKMIRSKETAEDKYMWSAIQYLDPDLEHQRSDSAIIFTMLSAVFLIGTILILLKLRGL